MYGGGDEGDGRGGAEGDRRGLVAVADRAAVFDGRVAGGEGDDDFFLHARDRGQDLPSLVAEEYEDDDQHAQHATDDGENLAPTAMARGSHE